MSYIPATNQTAVVVIPFADTVYKLCLMRKSDLDKWDCLSCEPHASESIHTTLMIYATLVAEPLSLVQQRNDAPTDYEYLTARMVDIVVGEIVRNVINGNNKPSGYTHPYLQHMMQVGLATAIDRSLVKQLDDPELYRITSQGVQYFVELQGLK